MVRSLPIRPEQASTLNNQEANMAKEPSKPAAPASEQAIPMHKALAMGQNRETGAGKGATGGNNPPKTPA